MAGVSAEVQFESPQKHRAGDDGLAEIADWVKTKEEAEAKAEAARLTEEPTKKKSNKGLSRVEATTVVTGRPTTNHLTDTNDLLTYAEPRPPVKVDLSGKNWIGQLFEYRQAHPSQTGPDYQETSPGLNLYTCLVTIGERPEPFGDGRTIFLRKKDAKQYAAKLAIEWLIANHHMPSDGSVSFPKARPQPAPNAFPAPGSPPLPGAADNDGKLSCGQRVAELCTKLYMSPPTYVIKAHTDFVAMYSGHAFFENGPMAVGKVGEFSNVYGKKRARETCAEMVLEYLEGVAGNRAGRAGSGIGERGERVPDFEGGESFE